MAVVYPEWTAGVYMPGNRVQYNGILYEALNARTATDTDNPQLDVDNWKVVAIIRIEDYNSLIEAIKLEINTTDDMINESIPMFIQMAEESFETRIRAPIQRATAILTADHESRVQVPEDLLQVINLRLMTNTSVASDTLFSRGGTEILAANFEEFKDLQRYYRSAIGFAQGRVFPSNYEAPVYWYDSQYFHIAPNIEEDAELELQYYAAIPKLGSEVNLVNQNGMPINAQGQTLAQWIAEDPLTHNVANFVQATAVVNVNWFVEEQPHLLLYGAIMSAESYLRDDPRMAIWQQKFQMAEQEVHYLIDRFTEGRHHTQQMYNAYAN